MNGIFSPPNAVHACKRNMVVLLKISSEVGNITNRLSLLRALNKLKPPWGKFFRFYEIN